MNISFHEAEILRLRSDLEAAGERSSLREVPDDQSREGLNRLLIQLRERHCRAWGFEMRGSGSKA